MVAEATQPSNSPELLDGCRGAHLLLHSVGHRMSRAAQGWHWSDGHGCWKGRQPMRFAQSRQRLPHAAVRTACWTSVPHQPPCSALHHIPMTLALHITACSAASHEDVVHHRCALRWLCTICMTVSASQLQQTGGKGHRCERRTSRDRQYTRQVIMSAKLVEWRKTYTAHYHVCRVVLGGTADLPAARCSRPAAEFQRRPGRAARP